MVTTESQLANMTTEQSASKVVFVRGANRGLGFSILQVAGLRDPSTTYILASRSLESGQAAKKQLEEEGIKAPIEVIQLDVTNDKQIIEAVKFVTIKYGKLDGAFSLNELAVSPMT
jgi:NAD(P)-dependent dehydrogenase (short-subunit alcohol dehydrogenase family)